MKHLLLCLLTVISLSVHSQYSWETKHANVSSTGDLTWAPQTFALVKGSSVRYIDYDNGNDKNDGLSTSTPWKRHPWDASATDNAKACNGTKTYIFKRGVIYRGTLTADDSGTAGDPIRLTSDPAWGTGEAAFYGSTTITSGWAKADATLAPAIPNANLVWYKNVSGLDNTKMVCEVTPTGIKRVRLARIPNFKDTPEEPMKNWWSFTGKTKVSTTSLDLRDDVNLTQANAAFFQGGSVWATEDVVVMCTLWKQDISTYTPATKTISVPNQNFGGVKCKYFIENTPYLLDTTSEYYYDKSKARMYLRLDADKDPNTTVIEAATKTKLIDLSGRSYIEISGLAFKFTTSDAVRTGNADAKPTIYINGTGSNLTVKNCSFQYLNGGVLANGASATTNLSDITVSDNSFENMDDFAVFATQNGGFFLNNIKILRNKVSESGARHKGRWYSSINAIGADLVDGEIAGNIVDHSWGSGINVMWGKPATDTKTVPFIRGFVHHNKVTHSLIGVNDYGGIEGWQGGPAFYYNNISHDASGYKYHTANSIGYAFYFDGAFKQYVFNNIATGVNWNKNASLYTQVLGFYNMWVHNDAYNAGSFSSSGGEAIAPDGQNSFLANVSDSTSVHFKNTTKPAGVPFESYYNNVFGSTPFIGVYQNSTTNKNFDQFVAGLISVKADATQLGWEAKSKIFTNAAGGNFKPFASSEVIDRGVKFFIPFPLSKVVGEWHFYKHNADSSLIKADNFYFTSDFSDRNTYNNVTKNHMKAYGLASSSFVKGNLEDWTSGALAFNGTSTYCSLADATYKLKVSSNVTMTTNSFILETYFKTTVNHTGGHIVSKYAASGYGYKLAVDNSGYAVAGIVNAGAIAFGRTSAVKINDGAWHHVLVEVNRASTINIYVDGVLSNGATSGTMPSTSTDITNTTDFLVGKNVSGNYFSGVMDFLRISKGTFAEAKTDIAELYKWQFDGPFLYDFTGAAPIGKRDAGAIEGGQKQCNLQVSPTTLSFGQTAETKNLSIAGLVGDVSLNKVNPAYYTATVTPTQVSVASIPKNSSGDLTSDFYVCGCNEAQKITVTQLGQSCMLISELPDTIFFAPNGESKKYKFSYNTNYQTYKGMELAIKKNLTLDSLTFTMTKNYLKTPLKGSLKITGCMPDYLRVYYQYGQPTGLNDVLSAGIKVMPNPMTQDYVSIVLPEVGTNCTATITDFAGRVLHKTPIFVGNNQVDFNIMPGVYLLTISGNNLNYTTKLIRK